MLLPRLYFPEKVCCVILVWCLKSLSFYRKNAIDGPRFECKMLYLSAVNLIVLLGFI